MRVVQFKPGLWRFLKRKRAGERKQNKKNAKAGCERM